MWYNVLLKTILLLIGLTRLCPVHGIFGGKETTINLYNYMVHIDIETKDGDEQCGGVLLANDIVLTAAHCFAKCTDLKDAVIVAGASKLSQQGFRRGIKEVVVPKSYKRIDLLTNDIALVKLDRGVDAPKHIKATIEIAGEDLPNNVYMKVLGWGATGINEPESETLREADVMTYSFEDCRKKFHPRLEVNNFCAFVNGKVDACKGDSGGPLIYKDQVYGIVSRGHSCGKKDSPGVYTNIKPFRKWINDTKQKLLKLK